MIIYGGYNSEKYVHDNSRTEDKKNNSDTSELCKNSKYKWLF